MTEQHTYCAALNCTRRGEHLKTCSADDCKGCWPREANRGYLCQHHYDRVEKALRVADQLADALADVERAIKSDTSSTVAGPRLPLSAWQMDLDRIERARADKTTDDPATGERVLVRAGYRDNLDEWLGTFQGALDALDFAYYVHVAEHAHPLEAGMTELRVVRCGGCLQRAVIMRPPDWYTGHRTLECTECGWSTKDDDHASGASYVELLVKDPYPRQRIAIPKYPIDLEQLQALAKALR